MTRLIWAAAVLVLLAAGLALALPPATAHLAAPSLERVGMGIAPDSAAPTPTLTPTGTAGPSANPGQWFLGAALVAIGVAGATVMLRLIRGLPRRPPSSR